MKYDPEVSANLPSIEYHDGTDPPTRYTGERWAPFPLDLAVFGQAAFSLSPREADVRRAPGGHGRLRLARLIIELAISSGRRFCAAYTP